MSANPQYSVITGTGKPRIIKEISPAIWTSGVGTVFTATTLTYAAGLPSTLQPGMRIRAKQIRTVGGQNFETLCYGKAISIDLGADIITVDAWVNGTPTNGQVVTADGWIADLDRTLEGGLEETFTPLQIVHNLYPNMVEVEERGYAYTARLDYEKRVTPDMLREMRNVMSQRIEGGDQNLILIPRIDKPGYNYRVYLPESFKLMLHQTYTLYKGFTLIFKGKQPVASAPHFLWDGYGMLHGTLYGTRY